MDAHTTQQPAQYHPLQDAPHEKAQRFQDHQPPYEPYQPTHSDVDDGHAPATGPTLLSVSRAVALTAVAVILLLLLTVIGLSAGLGVSQRDLRQVKGDLEAAQAVLSFASTGYVLFSTPKWRTCPANRVQCSDVVDRNTNLHRQLGDSNFDTGIGYAMPARQWHCLHSQHGRQAVPALLRRRLRRQRRGYRHWQRQDSHHGRMHRRVRLAGQLHGCWLGRHGRRHGRDAFVLDEDEPEQVAQGHA